MAHALSFGRANRHDHKVSHVYNRKSYLYVCFFHNTTDKYNLAYVVNYIVQLDCDLISKQSLQILEWHDMLSILQYHEWIITDFLR